ncbi:hypothetical protein E2C01_072479 [Portunus trituberculatus]|uniref:Uncharacterized protein n=1 Tax=Portunus trituberculatus TaxID=210409 RepID=A0A5B7I7X9_PORTR|nr:hypothetical protein [Portunus trituberculatus]
MPPPPPAAMQAVTQSPYRPPYPLTQRHPSLPRPAPPPRRLTPR